MSDKTIDPLELLAAAAYVAWNNVLSGCNSPDQNHYYERMGSPVVGDLVLETTSFRGSASDRIGRLKSITREPYPDWGDEDEPAQTREIWLIETLDGREFRWENCKFIAIPETPFNHQGKL